MSLFVSGNNFYREIFSGRRNVFVGLIRPNFNHSLMLVRTHVANDNFLAGLNISGDFYVIKIG